MSLAYNQGGLKPPWYNTGKYVYLYFYIYIYIIYKCVCVCMYAYVYTNKNSGLGRRASTGTNPLEIYWGYILHRKIMISIS